MKILPLNHNSHCENQVEVPNDLEAGEYVLSFRWDCKCTPQVTVTVLDSHVMVVLTNFVVASSGAFDNDNDTGTVGPASDVVVVVGVIVVVVVVVAPSSLFLGNISQVWTVCSNILVI